MSKPVLEMTRDKQGGVWLHYTTGNGRSSSTWFSAPPSSIDHVCINYLRGRLPNVRNWKQVDFIKRNYKELYKGLFGGE
ncbi:hypothetical protein BC01_095 [Bacillus phage BC01]|nr:hypothetical protein PBC6_087 [Bacillus phage PBC6]AXU41192.1 hypothetical protein BC01_095 [Bacillus phage BC01]